MIARVQNRVNAGAAVLFTDLVSLEWEGGAVLMQGRSGDYVASGHMTVPFAMELHARLGKLLAQQASVARIGGAKKKKRKRKKG